MKQKQTQMKFKNQQNRFHASGYGKIHKQNSTYDIFLGQKGIDKGGATNRKNISV